MTTERQYSVKLMSESKKQFRGCVVIKHADRFTRNIPDIQILWADRSAWVETKFLRKGKRLKDIVEKGQLIFGHELATVSGGRALVVVCNTIRDRVEVWTPKALFHTLWPELAAGAQPTIGSKAEPGLPFDPGNNALNALTMLKTSGMLWYPGQTVDLPMRVLQSGFTS